MFLVALAPIGYALLIRRYPGPGRLLLAGFGLASLSATLFYLSYWFTGPYGLTFGATHYFKIWFPLWTVAALFALLEAGSWLSAQRAGLGRSDLEDFVESPR